MSYLPIRVSTLRGDQKTDFDVYLKIGEKMILYVRTGDSFEGDRLQRLKEKKLKKMFILPEHEKRYRDYISKSLEAAYDNKSGKDLQTRAEIIQGQQQANAEELFDNPDQKTYATTKEDINKYVNFLMTNDKAVNSIFKIENSDKSISHHGVNVATLTTALAQKLKVDPKIMHLMALGALLHDYGHQDSGLEIARPLSSLSKEELALYRRHPEAGIAALQEQKHFDQLVLNIVAQHEECIDGSGFPKQLRENEMDPTVIMVSSANAFDRLMTLESLDPKEAGKKMMIEKVGKHPLNHIQILGGLLKG